MSFRDGTRSVRVEPPRRKASERVHDFHEIALGVDDTVLSEQAGRCLDCGVPFCHQGCPLGNRIPRFNDAATRGSWQEAAQILYETNNFPEFTGRLCPAPCESACVRGLVDEPVSIEWLEREIADRALANGWAPTVNGAVPTGKTVSIVGSGPTGLAAAQQLVRAGHRVAVYERAANPGGLLREGIPDFKLDKKVVNAAVARLEAEGVRFVTGFSLGEAETLASLRERSDAVLLAVGATKARDISLPGRNLRGVVQAMDFLRAGSRFAHGRACADDLLATDRDVIILGGGDTGSDCLGTALREGARSVTQLEILAEPPRERPSEQPWPLYPRVFRISSSQEEGGERYFGISTLRFCESQGRLTGIEVVTVDESLSPLPGTTRELRATLIVLALGFSGPDLELFDESGTLTRTTREAVAVDPSWETSLGGVFCAGDARRGASLVVWALAEGRSVARAIDLYLKGSSRLDAPLSPNAVALSL